VGKLPFYGCAGKRSSCDDFRAGERIERNTLSPFDFEAGDNLLRFTEAHDQKVHGHTLRWYLALPDWLTERSWTKTEQLDLAREHIQTVVQHYAGVRRNEVSPERGAAPVPRGSAS
jgi:GH35 family endo-1,4-beta-xylanase